NAKDVTPSVMQRLQSRQIAPETSEGFNRDFVTAETETLASGPNIEEQDTSVGNPLSDSVEGGDGSVNSSTLTNSETEDAQVEQTETVSLTDQERELRKGFIKQC